ncbi:protein LNK1-like isoform X2 [Salvia splendens]|nr:protein LNK1-like isoform X2 [Salvia splendens]XP_041991734.1 protein LNK1-like isoform X2 [Salvia splendens]XP_041991742.1 protein LNK1-like isoform X2 [Salvia splendens]XP_041991750.1 protein LNK1-like isoform X2 [Salvia splendens]
MCRFNVANIWNKTGGSATNYVDHRKEKSEISSLSNTKVNMLEKNSWSRSGPFISGLDNELNKEASSLACDSTMPLPHGLKSNNSDLNRSELLKHDAIVNSNTSLVDDSPFSFLIGDANHTGNDNSFFEHAQNKDSSDLLYGGWSEIENFDDIDRIFRSDSTLDLGVNKEDGFSWLSSTDSAPYIGGPGDALKSDAKFPFHEPSEVKTISENHDFSNENSLNKFAMENAPIRIKDCSCTPEKSDSYTSFLTGPDLDDRKDGVGNESNANIHTGISTRSHSRAGDPAGTNKHKKQIKLQSQSEGKVHCPKYGGHAQISDLQNEIMNRCSGLFSDEDLASAHVQQQPHTPASDSNSCLENPISSIHTKGSHLSDPSSVNLEESMVKTETNDFTSISSRDSHHASGQLQQYMDGFPGPPFKETGLVARGQREKLDSYRGNLSPELASLGNGSVAVQAMISDPGLVGSYENNCDLQGVSSVTATETDSSYMQESSTMVPNLDDISLEAASFHQLQLVTKQLDLRAKLCIRDSLYRLAQSAEQRRRNSNLNDSFGDERDSGGASEAEGTNRCTTFMDMETDTNPMDRSVAHLLFHRPIDSSTTPSRDSFSFKLPNVVHGSAASPPVLANSLESETKVSEV